MSIPLFNLNRVLKPHYSELEKTFKQCLVEGRFINGPQIEIFENQLANYLGIDHVIGVSSGSDALIVALRALGLQEGDEILVTPFTFVASASSILRAGLKPTFVDISPDSFHPSAEDYENAWTAATKGILFVHLFGEPGDLLAIKDLCARKRAVLIEDCAQSLGSRTKKGEMIGTEGDISTFSFFPAKNLGCLGDGGAVATKKASLSTSMRALKAHGAPKKYCTEILGGNFRLDTLHAAFLSVLLPHLPMWIKQRAQNAAFYHSHLSHLPDLIVPKPLLGHSWNQYTLRTPRRDKLKEFLDEKGIGNAIYYPIPLHKQPLFENGQRLPNVEQRCAEVISIPIYPGLSENERENVVQYITKFMEQT
jgi:dTDP-4-amino-4,6-dideoxygalactose transaminase